MNKLFIALLVCLVGLVGCDPNDSAVTREAHVCERREAFQRCMAVLPAGPVSTQYNDWDEVVISCDTAAYNQSRKIQRRDQPATCPDPKVVKPIS